MTCDEEIANWCQRTEKRLIEKCKQGKVREIWPFPVELYDPPAKDDPLQEPVLVKDWRRIMIRVKGVGPVSVNALRDTMLEYGAADTFLQALIWATNDTMPKAKGWGKGKKKIVRDDVGLPSRFEIAVEIGRE